MAKIKPSIGTAATTLKAAPARTAGLKHQPAQTSKSVAKRVAAQVALNVATPGGLTEDDVRRIISDFQTAGTSGQIVGRTTDLEPRVGSQLVKAVPRTTTNDLLAELETQISIMRSAFGDLQGRIDSILGPVPLDAGCTEKAPEPSVSQVNERLNSFIKEIQSTTTWINYVRERVEL